MTDSGRFDFFSSRFFLIFFVFLQTIFLNYPVTLSAQEKMAPGENPTHLQMAAPGSGSSTDNLLFLPGEIATTPVFLVPDPFTTTLRVLTSLIIVLSLVFGLSWFIQKRVGINRSVFGKVLGVFPLDGKRFIYLVEIMGKVLVLGVTEQQINLLCEISDKPTLDALRLQSETPTTPGLEKMFPFLKRNNTTEDFSAISEIPSHTQMTHQQKQQVEKLIIRREHPGSESRRQ